MLVRRFDAPEYRGIIFDTTIGHISSCVVRARSLVLEPERKKKIIRMLWLHDLPEAVYEEKKDVLGPVAEGRTKL